MPTVAVIIPAAGKSSRFGGRDKKPFVSLDGRAVWLRSCELFWTRDNVSKVYLVVAPEDREEFRGRFGAAIAFANAEIVDGGAERFDSVANALARVPDSVDLVAVHDAVRPLAPVEMIDAVFAAASQHGAAMPAVPVADTLKQVDPATNRITGTVPRAGLWLAQTPQVFRRDWLAEGYAKRATLGAAVTAPFSTSVWFEFQVRPTAGCRQAAMMARMFFGSCVTAPWTSTQISTPASCPALPHSARALPICSNVFCGSAPFGTPFGRTL